MISKGYFIFDGESSEDFGLYTAGSGTYQSPERDVSVYSVPGRSGNVIIDNGRFSNVTVVFTIVAKGDFKAQALAVKAWLLSKTGYKRLEDSFNPDYYRLARFSGSVEWAIGELLRYGYCDITFDCKPQLYRKDGEDLATVASGGTVTNPTRFTSLPLIKVSGTGAGTVTIGNGIIRISEIGSELYIDSDRMDCYDGSTNKNNLVTLPSTGFPKLAPGDTGVSFSGGVTGVKIAGRWWTV